MHSLLYCCKVILFFHTDKGKARKNSSRPRRAEPATGSAPPTPARDINMCRRQSRAARRHGGQRSRPGNSRRHKLPSANGPPGKLRSGHWPVKLKTLTGARPCRPAQRIGSQRFARRAILACKTARFGLRNEPKRKPKRAVSQANSAPVAKPGRHPRILVAYMQASHAKLLKAARRQRQGPEPWRGAATGRRHCKRLHNKYKPRANRVATIFVILRAENNRKNLGTRYGKNMEMVWQERQDNACHA